MSVPAARYAKSGNATHALKAHVHEIEAPVPAHHLVMK
jgi:hypothetical protein